MASPVGAGQGLQTVNQWLDTQKVIYDKKAESSAASGEWWKAAGVGLGIGGVVGTLAGLGSGKLTALKAPGASWLGVGVGVAAAVTSAIYLMKNDTLLSDPKYPTRAQVEQKAFNHDAVGGGSNSTVEYREGGSNLWSGETFAESTDASQTQVLRARFGDIDRNTVYATSQDAIAAAKAVGGDHIIMPANTALSHAGGDVAASEPSTPPDAGYYVYDVVGDVGAQLGKSGLASKFSLPESQTWLQHGNDVLIQHDGQLVKLQD